MNESGEVTELAGTSSGVTELHAARAALETAFEQTQTPKVQLYKENIALCEEIDPSAMFEEIEGESPALKASLHVWPKSRRRILITVAEEEGFEPPSESPR